MFTSFLHVFLHHFLWFPALSCIFNVFFQEFYPSPSFSDSFCTISFGCYHIFRHFHCIFPKFSCWFWTISSDHYHVFPQFLHPLRGFSMSFCICNLFFHEFYPSPSFSDGFCTISSGCYHIFRHFHCIVQAILLHRDGLFLAFARVSSIFQGTLYDFLWSLSWFPAVSLYFPTHPHGLSGQQKGGPRGNGYPTISKLPST